MPIDLFRSHRAEALVESLAAEIAAHAPADPFRPLQIVVGSRGMERWLRAEIATHLHSTPHLEFPFPRQAFDSAAEAILNGDPPLADSAALQAEPGSAMAFDSHTLIFRTMTLLRELEAHEDFAAVRRYLAEGRLDETGPRLEQSPVDAREIALAAEVADVLDKLIHDRSETAVLWATDPAKAPAQHRWLARLLHAVEAHSAPHSPARLRRALETLPPTASGGRMFLFGLSTLGPGDRALLGALARHMQIHLYLLAPSDRWWADIRSRAEIRRAWRSAVSMSEISLLEEQLQSQNPFLSSLGVPSRDIQVWLEELQPPYGRDDLVVDAPAPRTLLEHVQHFVREAGEPPAEDNLFPHDASISLMATHGAMRQCEVLRDELLGMFAADPTLEPRHVLVMTPDIETYAPLVSAVFARRERGARADGGEVRLPAIPTAISDLGLRRTNPVAEVLLQVLELCGERLTATRLLDLISLDPVRRRFHITPDDLGDIRTLIAAAGFRWALDAHDRAAFDQPALDQNTARFALERMALGTLLPDDSDDPFTTISGENDELPPAVPFTIENRERLARFGAIAAVLKNIAARRRDFSSPVTVTEWGRRLRATLDAFTATAPTTGWLRLEVEGQLQQLTEAAEAAGCDLPLDLNAIRRRLEGNFELPQRGENPNTGAVTVCALEPMRSVPFKVVALLGMDDGRFPRGREPRHWDPFSIPERGERDRRTIDRHLLLEALLSARERLIVLWEGRSLRSNEERPAAVPIEELVDYLARLTGKSKKEMVALRPLQPWSARNFGAGESRAARDAPQSFNRGLAQAASTLARLARGEAQPMPRGLAASHCEELPPERDPPRTIELGELARGLLKPQRALLRDRLGIRPGFDTEEISDREPLDLKVGGLDAWRLQDRLLPALRRDEFSNERDEELVRRFAARLQGEGTLPLAAGGRRVLRDQISNCRRVLANLATATAGEPSAKPLELRVRLDDGTELIGSVADLREDRTRLLLEWLTPSQDPNARLQLTAWVHLLAAASMELPVVGARLVGRKEPSKKAPVAGTFLAWSAGAHEARGLMHELTAIWRLARRRPLPLFTKTSAALADVLAQSDDLDDPATWRKAASKVAQAWDGDRRMSAEKDEDYIAELYGDWDPLEAMERERTTPAQGGFVHLARRIWLPISRAKQAGSDLAGSWGGEG